MGKKKRSIYISTELVLILVLLAAAVLITMLMEPHQVRTAVISAIFAQKDVKAASKELHDLTAEMVTAPAEALQE